MKILLSLCTIIFLLASCHKMDITQNRCNLQQPYLDNSKKVTIASGIWGTVSFTEGNCMPVIPPASNSCKSCPVQRRIKIYEYTLISNATPSANSSVFFDSFNSTLVAQVETDENGFFQISIPPGHYSVAVVENGKLYVGGLDGQGGLDPVNFINGLQNININMTYKAVF